MPDDDDDDEEEEGDFPSPKNQTIITNVIFTRRSVCSYSVYLPLLNQIPLHILPLRAIYLLKAEKKAQPE